MTTASPAQLSLHYEGPALASNRMDVQEIAPALLATANAVRAASRVLQPQRDEPRVEIQATAPGSFIVQLLVVEGGAYQRFVDLFSSDPIIAGLNFSVVVGYVAEATRALVRIGRNPRAQLETESSAPAVSVTFADGTKLNISNEAYRLMRDEDFRKGMHDVVAPLRRPGVDWLELAVPDRAPTRITREDVPTFDLPVLDDDPLVDETRTALLTIGSLAFTEGNKWRLSDGESTFYAAIEDEPFVSRVLNDEETFSRSDVLRARLRTRQWRTERGIRTLHTVVEVLEHIRGHREIPLPFEEPGAAASGPPPLPSASVDVWPEEEDF